MYWNFFLHSWELNTKVICMGALKLLRRENNSIKMNPTDFLTRSEIQDVRQGAFFRKQISSNFFLIKIHFRSFWIKKKLQRIFPLKNFFRKENNSIKINYTDFRPDRKFKMAAKERLKKKKISNLFNIDI